MRARLLLPLLALLSVFSVYNAHAQALTPPLEGDMLKLQVFDAPVPITKEIMFSSQAGGLSYLSEHKGKIVILNLWATWCPPCVEELPSMNALAHTLDPKTIEIVNVSMDKADPGFVEKYLAENKLDMLKPYMDVDGRIQSLEFMKDVRSIPVTIILNYDLAAIAMLQGDVDWNGRAARAVIDYYIANLKKKQFRLSDHYPM